MLHPSVGFDISTATLDVDRTAFGGVNLGDLGFVAGDSARTWCRFAGDSPVRPSFTELTPPTPPGTSPHALERERVDSIPTEMPISPITTKDVEPDVLR